MHLKDFKGTVTKGNIVNQHSQFVGDIYEDNIWGFKNMPWEPKGYIKNVFANEGIDTCVNLNGQYLFTHINNNEFYIGTDPFSVHPLYYIERDSKLYYATTVQDLVSLLPFSLNIDHKCLLSWIVSGPVYYDDSTYLEGVKRLLPGYIKYGEKGLQVVETDLFTYESDYTIAYDEYIYLVKQSLKKAIERRIKAAGEKNIWFGLSGGLDSRLLLGLAKEVTDNIVCYTYGPNQFIEKMIAARVSMCLGLEHKNILVEKENYLEDAQYEAAYSGGMSLFKHGPQAMFSQILSNHNYWGLMLGSSLDLLIGNSYPNIKEQSVKDIDIVKDFNIREEIIEYVHCQYLISRGIIDEYDHASSFDKACSFHIDNRVKKWYNRNLIYHLHNHRLLLPTYDKDFLKLIRKIPWEYRDNDSFRVDLLKSINYDLSKIIYNGSMQPAYIHEPFKWKFQDNIEDVRKQYESYYLETKHYIPSNTYDFNGLEWFRVYSEYQDFYREVMLSKDSILTNEYLDRDVVGFMLSDHVAGVNNHQIMIRLISAELNLRWLRSII